jgi:aspartate ammonia-lyase
VRDTHRIEHDLLGDRPVPAEAYYGVNTLRAVENFPITGNPIPIYPDLIRALACIKQAAALANHELRLLDRERADAIVKACEEIRAGNCMSNRGGIAVADIMIERRDHAAAERRLRYEDNRPLA